MICVTRLNGSAFYINPDLIEFIEETPNTVISFSTGRKVVVNESVEEIINRIIAFKNMIFKDVHIESRENFADGEIME